MPIIGSWFSVPKVGIANCGIASGALPLSEPGMIAILFVVPAISASRSYSYVSGGIVMRVSIPMIDVALISLMNPTLFFKMSASFITRRSPLLLFLGTMVFTIFFIVISSHPAN